MSRLLHDDQPASGTGQSALDQQEDAADAGADDADLLDGHLLIDIAHTELADGPDLRQRPAELAGLGLRQLADDVRAELDRRVAVALGRAQARDRVGLDRHDRDGDHRPVVLEDLGHADLAPDEPEFSGRHHILISMSTPAARDSRMRASTVFEDGSRMSTSRLWVRISNCSRLSLSMNGERRTVNFSIRVGSGTGPTTSAPVRWAVSTICAAD